MSACQIQDYNSLQRVLAYDTRTARPQHAGPTHLGARARAGAVDAGPVNEPLSHFELRAIWEQELRMQEARPATSSSSSAVELSSGAASFQAARLRRPFSAASAPLFLTLWDVSAPRGGVWVPLFVCDHSGGTFRFRFGARDFQGYASLPRCGTGIRAGTIDMPSGLLISVCMIGNGFGIRAFFQ